MARITAWRSAAAVFAAALALACTEKVTAPGHCPELCPADSLVLVDTILTNVISYDTSIRGFSRIDVGSILVASNQDSVDARPILQFVPLPPKWFPSSVDTNGVSIGKVDSVVVTLHMNERDTTVHGTYLRLYHLPTGLDSTTTFDSVAPKFATAFDSVPVPDSLRTADLTLVVTDSNEIARDWLPAVSGDSLTQALGIRVSAPSPTTVILQSIEAGGTGPKIAYFVHGAPPNDTLTNEFDLTPTFDSYVQHPDPSIPGPDAIVFGNQPAARAFIRFQIPPYFVDSVSVVRATLVLQTTAPVTGVHGDTVSMAAEAILRYLGGKSILFQDTAAVGIGKALSGQTSPVEIEMAQIFHVWHGVNTDSLPRDITLLSATESQTYGEVNALGKNAGALAPYIHISFVRPFRFGVP